MKILLAFLISIVLFLPSTSFAQEASPSTEPTIQNGEADLAELENFRPTLDYMLGQISEIISDEERDLAGTLHRVQNMKAKILRGPGKGSEVELRDHIITQESQRLKKGDTVVITKQNSLDGASYYVSDRYRLPSLALIFGIFFALAIFFAKRKGVSAILGLLVSLLILSQFVIPRILSGSNPLLVSLLGAVAIALLSLYLAHGFNRRTSIALVATLLTLGIAAGLSLLFVSLAKLTGLGSDEAFYLQLGPVQSLNLKGLLLGGVIIGVLGVLDDVTTAQVATVDEIHSADPKLSFAELYKRGLSVGQEHIVSLVNTLVLAYAGASFPLFLLFTLNTQMPLWAKLNSELIAEEVIRSLVGSSTLILAVPIATFLAAFYFEGRQPSRLSTTGHRH